MSSKTGITGWVDPQEEHGMNGRFKAFLHPGEMHVTATPAAITTILGSCVAVCLWDRSLNAGGVVHYILPGDQGATSPRYGIAGICALLQEMTLMGARTSSMEAKVFGGACMFESFRNNENHLGRRNTELARAMLDSAGIRITAADIGGERGRKVVFHTDTGETVITVL